MLLHTGTGIQAQALAHTEFQPLSPVISPRPVFLFLYVWSWSVANIIEREGAQAKESSSDERTR